jgi:hypothetical protein
MPLQGRDTSNHENREGRKLKLNAYFCTKTASPLDMLSAGVDIVQKVPLEF